MCSRGVEVFGPELRLFLFSYSIVPPVPLSLQHHSGSVCQRDALPVSARREDTAQRRRHHDHQGEHRGRVQQPGAWGVFVCVCVCYVGKYVQQKSEQIQPPCFSLCLCRMFRALLNVWRSSPGPNLYASLTTLLGPLGLKDADESLLYTKLTSCLFLPTFLTLYPFF